jgi:hypothetical protein
MAAFALRLTTSQIFCIDWATLLVVCDKAARIEEAISMTRPAQERSGGVTS